MKRVRGRTALIVAGALVVVALIAVPAAESSVTASSITTPTDLAYPIFQYNSPNTFAVAGTSKGTTGDHVDLVCYYGSRTWTVATNVAVHANGSFSANASLANPPYTPCRLRAIPTGTTPGSLTPFTGPRILVGYNRLYNVPSGPHTGALYDFYSFFSQLAGGFDYESLASCGVCDGYLSDTNFNKSTVTFWSNAALFELKSGVLIRSEIQVDGANAYPTWSANDINPNAAGLPKLTYSYSQNKKTGDVLIKETEPIVKCTSATYPATPVSCPTFVSTGVTAVVTLTQDHSGRIAWASEVFKSTDGKSHSLDLDWDNSQRFYDIGGNAALVESKFPGQNSYSTHVVSDTVPLPSGPGTAFFRMQGAADGDTATGQGAMVYDRTAHYAFFRALGTSNEAFVLHQTAKVPAGGSTRFRFAYVQGFKIAQVTSLAQYATTVFKGCTVPNVVGKSLAAAKAAIKAAHCSVGGIAHVHSSTIAVGDVVSESPKAKTHVDYGTKVSLKVSSGA